MPLYCPLQDTTLDYSFQKNTHLMGPMRKERHHSGITSIRFGLDPPPRDKSMHSMSLTEILVPSPPLPRGALALCLLERNKCGEAF